jgi:hypothetical protein
MPEGPQGQKRKAQVIGKPAAWTSVASGAGMVVVAGLQFAFYSGPIPMWISLALGIVGIVYVICAVIMLKRAYNP